MCWLNHSCKLCYYLLELVNSTRVIDFFPYNEFFKVNFIFKFYMPHMMLHEIQLFLCYFFMFEDAYCFNYKTVIPKTCPFSFKVMCIILHIVPMVYKRLVCQNRGYCLHIYLVHKIATLYPFNKKRNHDWLNMFNWMLQAYFFLSGNF